MFLLALLICNTNFFHFFFSIYLKEKKIFFDYCDIVFWNFANASKFFRVKINKRHAKRANQDIEIAQKTKHVQERTKKMLIISKVFEHFVFHN